VPIVLGVDCAASATTVELRDADDGKVFSSGRASHPAPAQATTQDPGVWWQGLVDARHEAGGALGVAAVSAAAPPQGVVLLDADHKPLGSAILAEDSRGSAEIGELMRALGDAADWTVAVGSVPDASFPIAKLAHLRVAEPRRFSAVAKVLAPHDWLTYRLSRRFVTDRGDASTTGYWSPRESAWRIDLLTLMDDAKDWGACLPRVAGPAAAAGDREGVVIAAGTGSPMSAALGIALEPRELLIVLDDQITVATVRERPTEDPTGVVTGFADATGRFLPQVRLRNGMNVIDAVVRFLGVDRHRFDQLALSAPSGSAGVTLLPGFEPERVARQPDVGGVLAGLRADVGPEHLARAAVEGVVCSVLDGVDALRAADVPVSGRISLIGSGARSHAFQRILADLSRRAVAVPQGERVATGACVQAAAALHGKPPEQIAAAWALAPTRQLDPSDHGDSDAVRDQYRAAQARCYLD
jgi:xylulokinase